MRKAFSVLFQAVLLALFVMALKTGSLLAQSEHAIEKAHELAKTHPEYEKDILLSKGIPRAQPEHDINLEVLLCLLLLPRLSRNPYPFLP